MRWAVKVHLTILNFLIVAIYVMIYYLCDMGGQRFFSGNRPQLLIIQRKIIGREMPPQVVVAEGHNYMKSNIYIIYNVYTYIWSCGGSEWYIMTRRSHTYIHIHIEIFWLSESDHAQYYIIHFNAELVVHSPSNFLPFPLISMNKFWGQRPQNSYGGSGWYSTTRRSHTYI